MIRKYLPHSTEELIRWYERYVSPISLLVGFSIDAVAAQVLDLWTYGLVLSGYLVLASCGILLFHLIEMGRMHHPRVIAVAPFVPVLIQFAFGGLFSGFVILYSKSASFAFSWVFVVILAALLLGNERFRKLYVTFPVQVGILFFALFSFSIFYVPVLVSAVGTGLFIVSGVVSLALISLFLYVALLFLPSRVRESITATARIIVGVFILINTLYFFDAVPPLPLALKDAGVFHSIERVGNDYQVAYEPRKWYEVYLRYNTIHHRLPGEPVYVYAAVFAPDGISTTLVHEWEFYDTTLDEWVAKDSVSFPISGGRAGGYRGYTIRRMLEEGKWRVNVRTDYGRLIGRVEFTVVNVVEGPALEQGVR